MTVHEGFSKRELQERLHRKLITPCIREELGPIWSRVWHSEYHWYSITGALIHLKPEARMAGIHTCEVTLCSSILGTQSWMGAEASTSPKTFKEAVMKGDEASPSPKGLQRNSGGAVCPAPGAPGREDASGWWLIWFGAGQPNSSVWLCHLTCA